MTAARHGVEGTLRRHDRRLLDLEGAQESASALAERIEALEDILDDARAVKEGLRRHEMRLLDLERSRKTLAARLDVHVERLKRLEDGAESLSTAHSALAFALAPGGTPVPDVMDALQRMGIRLARVESLVPDARSLPPDMWDSDGVRWTAKGREPVPGRTADDIVWEALVPDDRRPGFTRIARLLGEDLEDRGPFASEPPARAAAYLPSQVRTSLRVTDDVGEFGKACGCEFRDGHEAVVLCDHHAAMAQREEGPRSASYVSQQFPPNRLWDRFGAEWQYMGRSNADEPVWNRVGPTGSSVARLSGEQINQRGPFTLKSPLAEDQPPMREEMIAKIAEAMSAVKFSQGWRAASGRTYTEHMAAVAYDTMAADEELQVKQESPEKPTTGALAQVLSDSEAPDPPGSAIIQDLIGQFPDDSFDSEDRRIIEEWMQRWNLVSQPVDDSAAPGDPRMR